MIPEEIIKFYNRYKQKLYNISYRILYDRAEAEDAVQEVIIKYLKAADRITDEKMRKAWLTKACVSQSIDILRKRKSMNRLYENYRNESKYEVENEIGGENDDDAWKELIEKDEDNKLIALIYKELSTMPDGYRSILSMVLFEGLDYAEIAKYSGLTESTVRTQYFRGRKKLAEKLKKIVNNHG